MKSVPWSDVFVANCELACIPLLEKGRSVCERRSYVVCAVVKCVAESCELELACIHLLEKGRSF